MNVYLLLLLLFLCLLGSSLEILSGKSCRFLFIIILGLSAFIFATRNPNVVPDAEVYIYVYHRMEEANFNSWSLYNFYGFEPGYIFLNILCNKLGVTYVGFFAIVYLAQTLIAYKGMKILDSVHNNYVEKPKTFGACTFFAIYFGYFGMFYGAVVIRTGLALSLMFLAYANYQARKNKKAICYACIAILFHTSVIILLLTILVSTMFVKRSNQFYKNWLMIIVLLWLSRISIFMNKIILAFMKVVGWIIPALGKYIGYTNGLMGSGFFSKKNFLYLMLGVLFVMCLDRVKDKKYKNCLNVYLMGLTATYLLNEYSNGYRVFDQMIFFSLPLLLWVLRDGGIKKMVNRLICVEIVALLQFLMTYRILVK